MNPAVPIEVRRRRGNPGHRPMPLPVVPGGRPNDARPMPVPSGLDPEMRKAWRAIVRDLTEVGVLAQSDALIVEAAAVAIGRARQARTQLGRGAPLADQAASHGTGEREVDGLLERGSQGWGVSALVRLERESWAEFRQLSSLLGLDPSTRARLAGSAMPRKATLEDEADRLIGPNPRHLRIAGGSDG